MRMMVRVGEGSPCDVIAHQTEAPSRGTPQVGGLMRSLGVSVAKPHYKLPKTTLALMSSASSRSLTPAFWNSLGPRSSWAVIILKIMPYHSERG